jgi:hypothetical protein
MAKQTAPLNVTLGDNIILKNESKTPIRNRILIGTPTLGIVRIEWATARYGQVIPCNWTVAGIHVGYSHTYPLGYLVADAQNILVDVAVKQNYEWLFLIEDDVIMPPDCFLKLNEYMKDGTVPVVSGLYFLKSNPPEPLVYRGRGNGACYDWKMGEKIWVDGVPTGCLLIKGDILKLMYDESPDYVTGNGQMVKKVFETPAKAWLDPETGNYQSAMGTSDLYWCDRVMREKVLQRTGYKKIGNQKNPFLLDTSIFCKHVDMSSGTQYPVGLIWDQRKKQVDTKIK